jgi:hypothetical protein
MVLTPTGEPFEQVPKNLYGFIVFTYLYIWIFNCFHTIMLLALMETIIFIWKKVYNVNVWSCLFNLGQIHISETLYKSFISLCEEYWIQTQ